MTAPTCIRCGKPTADGYACAAETTRAAAQLAEIADMTPAARDIAHGLSRHGGGAAGGKPGSRLPLDLGATARLDAVRNALGGWVRHVAETRGIYPPSLPPGFDALVPSARFLAEHLEWYRHRPEVDELLGDIEACHRVVRGIARGPAEQKYLGPCGATVTWDDDGNEVPRDKPCEGDVYGHPGAESGACRGCKARWAVAGRRAWLDEQVRTRAYRASEIEDAYGVKANLIRQWATPERGLVRVHDRDFLGRARYLLGEVLDVAAQQEAKAAERAAKREQRAARDTAEMGA